MTLKNRTSRNGFSLLEMLFALALISILAASLYASLSIAYRARQSADRALRHSATVELAIHFMQTDIQSALPARGILAGSMIADDEISNGGYDADILEFYATRPVTDLGEAVGCDICHVQLLLVEDEDHWPRMILVRRITRNLLAATDPIVEQQVLCRNVQSLNFRYYDGYDWLDTWDSSVLNGDLPLAIEVSLTMAEDDPQPEDQLDSSPTITRVLQIPASVVASGGIMEGM